MASRSGGYLLTNRRLELEQKSQDLASKVLMEALFLVLYCAAALHGAGLSVSSSLDRNRSRIALYRSPGPGNRGSSSAAIWRKFCSCLWAQ